MSEKKPTITEVEEAVRTIISWLGDDPKRSSLLDTPARVAKAYKECFVGYQQNPQEILNKTFEDVGGYEEVVMLEDIGFTSYCEHHLLPFKGKANIAYVPDKKVVGISKLARIVDCFAKRLQIQERLTVEIARSIEQHIKPKGVAVAITAEHECMACRGANKRGAQMRTYSYLGEFKTNKSFRDEFLGNK